MSTVITYIVKENMNHRVFRFLVIEQSERIQTSLQTSCLPCVLAKII